MKVLIIASDEGVGLTYHLTNLSIALKREGVYVSVISGKGEQIKGLKEKLEAEGISHYTAGCVDNLNPFSVLWDFKKIYAVIKKEKPDIIHANGLTHVFHAYLPSRKFFSGRKINFAVTIRSDIFTTYPLIIMLKTGCYLASSVIPICKSMEQKLIGLGVPAKKVTLIPNFIDINNFHVMKEKYASEFKNLSLFTSPGKTIAYPAMLRPEKGHVYFLEAAKNVLHEFPETKFLIIGDGPLKEDLQKKSFDLGISENVFFMGYVKNDQIPALMSLIDIGVSASLSEQFSKVVLEILAAGKPIICTNVGSVPDFMINGESGMVIPPGNVAEISKNISLLLRDSDKAGKMGIKGREIVENTFDVRIVMKQMKNLFESLV